MYQIANWISIALIPIIILAVPLYALYKRVPVYESFIDGAQEGLPLVMNLLPHLIGMMVAVAIFRETGALNFYLNLLAPVADFLHIPREVMPIGIIRPLTSSGSLALVESAIRTYGADSMIGRIAATIQGSSETTLYVLTVYFGSIGIKKSLYSLKVGLLADLASFIAAVVLCYILF